MSVAMDCITVYDSTMLSIAQGSMAMRAAQLANDGHPVATIRASLDSMKPRFSLYFMVDTLTYLQRGGRVSRGSSMMGGMLNVKPILSLKDGEVVPVERVRSREKALEMMADLVRQQGPLEEAYVLHTVAPDVAAQFAQSIQPLLGGLQAPILPLGPVVGANLGPGAIGVVTLRR